MVVYSLGCFGLAAAVVVIPLVVVVVVVAVAVPIAFDHIGGIYLEKIIAQ